MSDLPPGKGHAKHSDRRLVEANGQNGQPAVPAVSAVATPAAPPTDGMAEPPAAQPGVPVTLKTTQLAALLAEFNQEQGEKQTAHLANIERLLERILKQSIETNYYTYCLAAGKKPTEAETRQVLGMPPAEPAPKPSVKAKRARKPS